MSTKNDKSTTSSAQKSASPHAARLAAALRANLQRRKAQAKERKISDCDQNAPSPLPVKNDMAKQPAKE